MSSQNNKTQPFSICSGLYLLWIILIIQLRGDGYFPFPKHWSEHSLMTIVLFHTLLLIYFIVSLVKTLISKRPFEYPESPIISNVAYFGIPFIAMIAISFLHILQSKHFFSVGYLTDHLFIIKIFALSIIPLVIYWIYYKLRKKHAPLYFLACIIISSILLKMIPLELFPITANRSDMLPILKEASLKIFQGENPYQIYLLDNGAKTPNVRFPGLILAYLLPSITNSDLRIASIFFETLSLILFIWLARNLLDERLSILPKILWSLIIPLTCFILLPYWHYRHEIYESPFWLIILFAFLAFDRNHALGFGVCLGCMLFTHQWGLLFIPYMLIAFYRKNGLKSAAKSIFIAITLPILSFFLFLEGNFLDFYQHTIGTYKDYSHFENFYPMSMYFSAWLVKFGFYQWLVPLQIVSQFIILYLVYEHGRKTYALAGILALSLTLVLIFNPVAWTYQYLLVIFLLLIAQMYRCRSELVPGNR